MSKQQQIQSGNNALTLITHPATTVFDVLNKHVPAGKVGWPSDTHFGVVQDVCACLEDSSGNPVDLPAPLKNIIKLIFKPSEDSPMEVLTEQLRLAGYALSPEAKNTFVTMLNAAQFGKFLDDTINPKTGKPFITLEKKRGQKKKAFAALIPTTMPTPATRVEEVKPEESAGEATAEAEATETTDVVAAEPPPPAPAKAAKK